MSQPLSLKKLSKNSGGFKMEPKTWIANMDISTRKLVLTDTTDQNETEKIILSSLEIKNILQHRIYNDFELNILEILSAQFYTMHEAVVWLMDRIPETEVKSIHIKTTPKQKIFIRIRF